ncbi:IS110 family transposase, partial [Escherichia coli]
QSVMRCVKKLTDSLSICLQRMEARRGFLKTTGVLANKLTRIIWRVLSDSIDFNMQKAVVMN